MSRRSRRRGRLRPLYSFTIAWIILSTFMPLYQLSGLLITLGISSFVAYRFGRQSAKQEEEAEEKKQEKSPPLKQTQTQAPPVKSASAKSRKSYGPQVDPIIEEGNRALAEMGRIYQSVKDPEIRQKINEIMRITDKITQDAIADPSDIPQIKKFMNYYLPTTIKLLNAYDRMSFQGIEGENLDRSMKSITSMLDDAIAAYKKMLDSLFENQALDIETDIEVMNKMLAREGLAGEKDFQVGTSQGGR